MKWFQPPELISSRSEWFDKTGQVRFTSEEHRGYGLLKAHQDLTLARRYGDFGTGDVAGAAFVLRPPHGRFDLRHTAEIDQDIERLTNTLEETGVNVIVREDAQHLTDAVIEYIGTA